MKFADYLVEHNLKTKFTAKCMTNDTKSVKGNEYNIDMNGYIIVDPNELNFNESKYDKINAIDSNLPVLYKCGKFRITSNNHVRSQAKDKRPELSGNDWNTILESVRNVTLSLYPNKFYIFYDNLYSQGFIGFLSENGISVETILPKGKMTGNISSKELASESSLMVKLLEHNVSLGDIRTVFISN